MRIINLLPKDKQEELKHEAIYHGLVKLVWISLFTYLLVFGSQLGTKAYLEYKATTLESDIERLKQQVNKQDNAAIKKEITGINNIVNDFKSLYEGAPHWSNVLKEFSKLPPTSVTISSLQVDLKTKAVSINGYAPTREAVIELYNNILRDEKHFTGVDYPLENVAKPTENNFHFTFYVQDAVLK